MEFTAAEDRKQIVGEGQQEKSGMHKGSRHEREREMKMAQTNRQTKKLGVKKKPRDGRRRLFLRKLACYNAEYRDPMGIGIVTAVEYISGYRYRHRRLRGS